MAPRLTLVSDPACNTLGCGFAGLSEPGPCVQAPGVMSLAEIKTLIATGSPDVYHVAFLADALMKQITWADQWIGFDDEDTLAAKKRWANNLCLGGTMAWSVDFNAQTPAPVSMDGNCGVGNGQTCVGSVFGDCCSQYGEPAAELFPPLCPVNWLNVSRLLW